MTIIDLAEKDGVFSAAGAQAESGAVSFEMVTTRAAVPPTATDDVEAGWGRLSLWLVGSDLYVCLDPADGHAVWMPCEPPTRLVADPAESVSLMPSHSGATLRLDHPDATLTVPPASELPDGFYAVVVSKNGWRLVGGIEAFGGRSDHFDVPGRPNVVVLLRRGDEMLAAGHVRASEGVPA